MLWQHDTGHSEWSGLEGGSGNASQEVFGDQSRKALSLLTRDTSVMVLTLSQMLIPTSVYNDEQKTENMKHKRLNAAPSGQWRM